MFAKYKLKVSEVDELVKMLSETYKINVDPMSKEEFESKRMNVRKTLLPLIKGATGKNGVIDGKTLSDYTFPVGEDGKYDVFISHSHDDRGKAYLLTSWLQKYCNLNVFLDSLIWKSADGLLQEIDDIHCKNKGTGNYIYRRRNYSTAHVHAMLSMAIMDIINKTECCIFLESDNSIDLKSLDNTSKATTLSPWIYEELQMMKCLQPRHSSLQRKMFSNVNEGRQRENLPFLKMMHEVDLKGFLPLTCKNLSDLYDQGFEGLMKLYKATLGVDLLQD